MKKIKINYERKIRLLSLSAIVLTFIGFFLLLDVIFLHLISFNYAAIGLAWLDPYVSHGYFGIILVVVGLWGLVFAKIKS